MKETLKRYKYAIGAGVIPFLCLTGIMIATETAPFGDHSFMIVDALHQYLPFFADYQRKLQSFDSMFYSWNGGLGYNFCSLWAYYLSSPLNLVIALVPKIFLIPLFNWLIVLKFSLCSLTAFSYFTYREGKQSLKNMIFGLCYAFSSYMTGYYWNVMWMEVMIFLPLVLIGMDRLMKENKGRWYCFCLFASMFCNYYMTFMVCIFLVLWFFTYRFEGRRDFLEKGIRFAGWSILAAMMSAVVLLPAYLGLMGTSSAKLEFPTWSLYDSAGQIFATHLAAMGPNNMSVDDGLGNLYCGVLTLGMVFLYLIDYRADWKEKCKKAGIVLFLGISFQVEILNYIWHGFHDQYGIPNRFAFLYVFLLLILAYEQITQMERRYTKTWKILGAGAVVLALMGVLYVKTEPESWIPYGISAGLVIVYTGLLWMRKRRFRKLLYGIVLIELIANTAYGFYYSGQMHADYYFSDTLDFKEIVENRKPFAGNRMEVQEGRMLDESIWHTMPGISLFGSTALGTTVDAMDQLGFYTGVNEYLYEGATPFTDMLLGVRDLVTRYGEGMYRTNYEYLYTKGEASVYESTGPASIGYWMNEAVDQWDYQSENPFWVQNHLVQLAYGCPELFEEVIIDPPVAEDCEIEKVSAHGYSISDWESQEDNVVFILNIEEYQDLYLHFDCGDADNTVIKVNGSQRLNGRLNAKINSIGYVEPGDTVSIRIQLEDEENPTGNITIRAAKMNKDALRKVKNKMAKHQMKMETVESGYIKGTIVAPEDGRIFFSIPYDKGWTVKANGRELPVTSMAEGFLAVDVGEGKYDLELTYHPPGFSFGLKLTILGWIVFCFPYIRKKRFIKNS